MTLSDEIYDLMIRNLVGTLNSEEEIRLSMWLRENPEGQKQMENLSTMFTDIRQVYSSKEPDAEICFREVERCLGRRETRKLHSFMRYAALFVLPLTVIAALYWLRDEPLQPTYSEVVVQTTSPVSQKAHLLLSSGEKVELAPDQQEVIREEAGMLVHNTVSGLNYQLMNSVVDSEIASEYNTLIVPRGSEYALTLSDGTKIWLNAESELTYPVKFAGKKREVYLKGEAYFDVTPNASSPFVVQAGDMNIKVLGTTFNVMAYKNYRQIEITLEKGCVEVNGGGHKLEITPGMQAVFEKASGELYCQHVNTQLYISWRENRMIFEELRLEELFDRLSRWYDVEVFYQSSDVKDIRLTGNLSKHEDISVMLNFLESMGKVHFHVNGKTIIVLKSK